MNKKPLAAFAVMLLLAAVFVLGCNVPQNDPQAMVKFEELKIKYGIEHIFSPNASDMSSYISELSSLRGKSSLSAAKVIDAELYSAQGFYYLSKALSESSAIDYIAAKCSAPEIKNASSFARLSSEASAKAAAAISSLNAEELKHMRASQLEMVKEYATSADQLTAAIKQIC
jgi:hypothetical protein